MKLFNLKAIFFVLIFASFSSSIFALKTFATETKLPDIKSSDPILILVTKTNALPASFVPKNLIKPAVLFVGPNTPSLLSKPAGDAYLSLYNAAKKDGITLFVASAYRSYAKQKSVFAAFAKQYGYDKASQFSAHAGHSEHQTGLALDITSKSMNFDLSDKFASTMEGKWLAGNAYKYGFIMSYPEGMTEKTGYEYEPWHFRFLGFDSAMYLHDNYLILGDYIALLKNKENANKN
jgi:D-alanyl-D-alanine carboxypeptidase